MALSAVFTSSTGLQAANTLLDVTSNNVANANTNGFKTSQVTFQDLLYTMPGVGAPTPGVTPPGSNQVGTGTVVDAITGLFTQGGLVQTGSLFDLAITGEGFFAVTLPDGSTGYTRAGDLTLDSTGQLVTSDGFRLVDGIVVPANATSVNVSATGVVTATTPDGEVQIGTINLTSFRNPAGLQRVGDTTFVASPASGDAVTDTPGTNGLGTLTQGFLEQSNVDITSELINLIVAQRSFSFNAQAIQVETQVLQTTTDLIR